MGKNKIIKYPLSTEFPLSKKLMAEGIQDLDSLILFIQHLPYGRTSNRANLNLVFEESKGTCSSKHGFIKKIAEENSWDDIELIIGIYKMDHLNTPKIGDTLVNNGFDYIPEAHCYLKIKEERIDITSPFASFDKLANDILEEHPIDSTQVNTYKVELHHAFLKNWINRNNITSSFNQVWKIREKCIKKLSE